MNPIEDNDTPNGTITAPPQNYNILETTSQITLSEEELFDKIDQALQNLDQILDCDPDEFLQSLYQALECELAATEIEQFFASITNPSPWSNHQ